MAKALARHDAGVQKQKIVRMKLDKETKGAVRYQEIDAHGGKISTDIEGALLVSVYMRKAAVREWQAKVPKMISITVTALE